MVDIMGNEVMEVIKWYNEQLGRKLTEAEKASIRVQVLANKVNAPEIKRFRKIGILPWRIKI